MTIPPIPMRWEGDVMRPRSARLADKHFVVGMTYRLVEHQERSTATHNHYFAAINEAWQSLPDHLMAEYPSPEHLRKKMLIRAGYCDETTTVLLGTKADALRVAAMARGLDEYAIVVVRENVVTVYRAQTQSYKGMDRKTFAESKEKVLDAIYALLGVPTPERAKKAA